VKVRAGAGLGGLRPLPRCGWGLCCPAGYGVGRYGGLSVTPDNFGIRTRKKAWRWGLDLKVAHCCLEQCDTRSHVVSELIDRRSGMPDG
jgi:hypothetical protein